MKDIEKLKLSVAENKNTYSTPHVTQSNRKIQQI